MSRRSLGFLAITLILLMGIVASAGLDNLPRRLRNSVDAAATQLANDRTVFEQNRAAVERALSSEPELFRTQTAAWRGRLEGDQAKLAQAATELTALQQLAKENRRSDQKKVEEGLARLESKRVDPVRDAGQMRSEAERWLKYKQELPQQLQAMRSNYDAIHAFDVEAATAPVRSAMTDWPAKREDLDKRVADLSALKQEGERAWESSAAERAKAESRKAEADQASGLDYATLFQSGDRLNQVSGQLKERSESLNKLAGQLYVSWDKLLLDLDDDNGYREKVKVVRTRYKDAALTEPSVSEEEHWEPVEAARFTTLERNVGMTIERKTPGKYDSEAEKTVQPPAYAYIAPPGQSNQYGAWSGGVWTWLPQYLILSRLLQGPVTSGDWYGWDSARRRGDVYYGRYGSRWEGSGRRSYASRGVLGRMFDRIRDRDSTIGSGRSSGGGFYRERGPSAGTRGYGGSRYQSRGTYGGSRFQSPGGFRSYSRGGSSFGRSLGRAFSRGGRR